MAGAPKRFTDRVKPQLRKYVRILETARKRDINESDTVVIVSDMLADLLHYDKFDDVTTEYAIHSTFCDLAIKSHDRVQYLIEVKSIGTELRDNHLQQAINYGAQEGIDWVLLTNGAVWQAHRIRFEKPITHDLVFTLDLLNPDTKAAAAAEMLYLISKEAGNCSQIEGYWKQKEATSQYVIALMLLGPSVQALVRRQLRRYFKGLKVSVDDIDRIMRSSVLKREVLDGEKAVAAKKFIQGAAHKQQHAAHLDAKSPETRPIAAVAKPALQTDG